MEVRLFLFAVGYLLIILIGLIAVLMWSGRRNYGFLKTAGVVLATLFVIYAVPFGDHTLGEIKKYQLCEEHGGTKIYQAVENVDGFMWAKIGQAGIPYSTHGFAFFETSNLSGEIFRYAKNPDGSVTEQKIDKSIARYLARSTGYEKIGQHHLIRKFEILDLLENKVIATHGLIAYDGGWLGYGSVVCPAEPFDAITFVKKTLQRRVPESNSFSEIKQTV